LESPPEHEQSIDRENVYCCEKEELLGIKRRLWTQADPISTPPGGDAKRQSSIQKTFSADLYDAREEYQE
jgi:hypothetical protein